jgi:hypothetical protein
MVHIDLDISTLVKLSPVSRSDLNETSTNSKLKVYFKKSRAIRWQSRFQILPSLKWVSAGKSSKMAHLDLDINTLAKLSPVNRSDLNETSNIYANREFSFKKSRTLRWQSGLQVRPRSRWEAKRINFSPIKIKNVDQQGNFKEASGQAQPTSLSR